VIRDDNPFGNHTNLTSFASANFSFSYVSSKVLRKAHLFSRSFRVPNQQILRPPQKEQKPPSRRKLQMGRNRQHLLRNRQHLQRNRPCQSRLRTRLKCPQRPLSRKRRMGRKRMRKKRRRRRSWTLATMSYSKLYFICKVKCKVLKFSQT
jgi:hypothetical protein